MFYEYSRGTSAQQCSQRMCESLSDRIVSERTVLRWYAKWKGGDMSLEDDERSGRPVEIDLDELKQMVDNNPSFTCLDFGLELGVSDECIRLYLHKLGYVSKLNTWVPHNLSPAQKSTRREKCSTALKTYTADDLDRLVTVDEKWLRYKNYHRQRSWVPKGSSPGQTPKRELTKDKVLLVCF